MSTAAQSITLGYDLQMGHAAQFCILRAFCVEQSAVYSDKSMNTLERRLKTFRSVISAIRRLRDVSAIFFLASSTSRHIYIMALT